MGERVMKDRGEGSGDILLPSLFLQAENQGMCLWFQKGCTYA